MVEQTSESKQVWNFSAGPCTLPHEVLKKAQDELLNWHGTGVSVMCMSHRSASFKEIAEKARSDLAQLLEVPDTHQIFFF
jgi:phosphoserine aminotransferase